MDPPEIGILTKAKGEDNLAPGHRTEGGSLGGELDHDEPSKRVFHQQFLGKFNLIMINLQMAREKVSQVATVWIITVKLVWNTMKMPQPREY